MHALQFYKKNQRFFSPEHALHCSVCFPLVLRFWVVPFSLFFCSRSSRRYDTAPTNFYSLDGDDDSLCFLIVCLEKETGPALEILPLNVINRDKFEIIFIAGIWKMFRLERINGETIAGIAFVFLSILFLYAGAVNQVWAIIVPADFLILAIGAAFIALGVITLKRQHSLISS